MGVEITPLHLAGRIKRLAECWAEEVLLCAGAWVCPSTTPSSPSTSLSPTHSMLFQLWSWDPLVAEDVM